MFFFFLTNPFKILFIYLFTSQDLVSIPLWICKVMVLYVMDLPSEMIPSIRTTSVVVMSAHRVTEIQALEALIAKFFMSHIS